ncbi:hypothetical protein [Qipengyuania sediminis]|uniref:hypothetical protein n=1 Tax=Qipengyuania sediminis TaxID=1532023 RepID=UPI0010598A5B|nr:hypothetical protein [Qipengyuania sediminis]
MRRPALIAAALAALATPAPAAPPAGAWEIGPIIRGRNYSVNMPLVPEPSRAGPSFAFPGPAAANGHVHYVTTATRPLEGARRIVLTYRIDAAPGTRFVPQESPGETATLSLYFQRAGDGWTKRQPDWRWYAPASRLAVLRPGTHTVSIALTEDWVAMTGSGAHANPDGFAEALAETARVGFTFGSPSARGHGVYATGPARFTILDFRVE